MLEAVQRRLDESPKAMRQRRESNRRDWERLQALAQVLHRGTEAGEWAQLLAVQELVNLKRRRIEALLLANNALTYWETKNMASPALRSELPKTIEKLSK